MARPGPAALAVRSCVLTATNATPSRDRTPETDQRTRRAEQLTPATMRRARCKRGRVLPRIGRGFETGVVVSRLRASRREPRVEGAPHGAPVAGHQSGHQSESNCAQLGAAGTA
jgi:hypothetical protein